MSLAHLTKLLVIPNLFILVWFVANFLAAHRTSCYVFTDSNQNFGKPLAANPASKNWLANFGRASVGNIQTGPLSFLLEAY
jgi:hypothetical protein